MVESVSIEKIADSTGTPVYIYSTEAFLTPLKEFQRGLASVDHLICFAVKANSNINVLKLLGDAGAGMDLVSGGELHRVGLAKIPADRVVFSGVGKSPGEMAAAMKMQRRGIFCFNVESTAEIETLNAVAESLNQCAPVALRFNPDVNPKTHPYISTGLKKNKFGMDRKEILEIVRNLKNYRFIEIKGLSIHIGSQLLSLDPLDDAFQKLGQLIDELNTKLPRPLTHVDLGGGLGITYSKGEKSPPIRKYCELVLKHFGPNAQQRLPFKILIEPGRILSGNSGILVTEVLYRKERPTKDFLIVDAAMNDLLRPSLYGSFHDIVPVKKLNGRPKKTDIAGPVCETGDCFAHDRAMTTQLKSGDLLAILSAGAYGFTMSSNYNSRPRPPEVLVSNGKFTVIRERENYDDLTRGEAG